jgi:glycosyltransferase involved in cell wall biosynthesis
MKEFASALTRVTNARAWVPVMSSLGHWRNWEETQHIADPELTTTLFPLQRGYSRAPFGRLLPFEDKLIRNLGKNCLVADSPLVCSTPFYSPVAEQWGGPVIYYVTDLTKQYASCDARQVVDLDIRLCKRADLICPNSRRIADYLIDEAACDPAKILIVPNATRRTNVLSTPSEAPAELPEELAAIKRPIAGVIGNLAGNMDWVLLKDAIERTPFLSWVFVGPSSMKIEDPVQSSAKLWAQQRAHFVGSRPYGQLRLYARAFDVAVLPYRKVEPTYSGSSTRYYEHLAAGRPMVSTRGFAELLDKEPLVKLVNSSLELANYLEDLRGTNFTDGNEILRWECSKTATWEQRAREILETYNKRLGSRSLAALETMKAGND